MGQKTTKSLFLAGGAPTEEKKLFLRNFRKPSDSVVTFFFDSGTPFAVGPARGPAGLVASLLLAACCLLLDKQAPPNLINRLKYYYYYPNQEQR